MLKTLQHLSSIGVGYHLTHDAPGGGTTIDLRAEDVCKYASNPVSFLASYYGVTASEYVGWHASNFSVQCSASTVKGHRCRATIPGGTFIGNPKKWAELQGGYCAIHRGAS